MREMQFALQQSASSSTAAAVITAQRLIRGWLGRRRAAQRLNEVYEKIYDPHTQGYYYYHTGTDVSSWEVSTYLVCLPFAHTPVAHETDNMLHKSLQRMIVLPHQHGRRRRC
jgi:hypothetical protein